MFAKWYLSYETETFVSVAKEKLDNKESQKATVFRIICKELNLRGTTTYFIASGGNESFTLEFHFWNYQVSLQIVWFFKYTHRAHMHHSSILNINNQLKASGGFPSVMETQILKHECLRCLSIQEGCLIHLQRIKGIKQGSFLPCIEKLKKRMIFLIFYPSSVIK